MDKLKDYFKNAWKPMLVVLILCSWFAFFLMSYLFSTSWAKKALASDPSVTSIILVTVSFLALLALAYAPARIFWERYLRNYTLRKVPFTYVDAMVLFVGGVVLLASLFPERIMSRAAISFSVSMLLSGFGLVLVVWVAVIRYQGYKAIISSRPPENPPTEYFPDEPITRESEDILGRSVFVEDFYKQIVNYPSSESFVFGLYGTWGEGKTSVINLLKNKLSEHNGIIVVEFDPWYFASPEALIGGFYEGLHSALNKPFFFPNLKRLLTRYQEILSAGLKNIFGINIGLGQMRESLDELKERIQDCIARTEKRLVILIDDIDRLRDRDEVLLIFKLVKLSGKFNNTIFVLSFDEEIVSSLLNDDKSTDPDFLAKIVQSPVSLPSVDQDKIDAFLYVDLEKSGHRSGMTRLFERLQIMPAQREAVNNVFGLLYPIHINRLFGTLRDAKRFLNGLHARLPAIKDEVHLGDFLILECIRVFYPRVYKDIWDNRGNYIPSSWSLSAYEPDRQKQQEDVKTHIEKIMESERDRDVLLELLKTIFVKVRASYQPASSVYGDSPDVYREQQRITHPEVFPRYFTLLTPPAELSDQAIRSLLTAWSDTPSQDRESRILEDLSAFLRDDKLPKLLDRLRVFAPSTSADVQESLVRALYWSANAYREPLDKQSPSSPYFKVRALIFQLINASIEDANIQPFLMKMIEETPSLDLATTVVHWSDRGADTPYFRITENARKADLQQALSERLKKDLIDSKKNIFEEEKDYGAYVLYQWGLYAREMMNKYVFALLEQHPQYVSKVIEPFISHLGSPLPGGGTFKYEDLAAHYDKKRLYEYAKKRLKTADIPPNEKAIIDILIKRYETSERDASRRTEREANGARFTKALNEGREYFQNKKFTEALKSFDEALRLVDWDDLHNWKAQARYEKWKCLLELSWNNGVPPLQDGFNEAQEIAGNEAELQELVKAAYHDPYKVFIEFYNCLFYYLVWHFANHTDKTAATKSFYEHYTIATQDRSSSAQDYLTRLTDIEHRIKA